MRSNVVASQVELHARYRGVVPEIASRAHIENILPVIREALARGADRAIQIDTDEMPEPLNVAKLLAKVVEQEQPGLVILGKQSIDDDQNQVGQYLAARLGLAHAVDAHWATTPATPRAILPAVGNVDLGGATFAVRGRRVREHHPDLPLGDVERTLGALLAATGKVDLRAPKVEVRVLLAEWAYVGALLAEVDRAAFEARAVKNRPFFSPVSLHPRFARALVNLARVRHVEARCVVLQDGTTLPGSRRYLCGVRRVGRVRPC